MIHKVLVVDDQEFYTILAEKVLSSTIFPIKTYSAANGSEACIMCESEMPNLILMDWEMPQMTGIEAIKKLKSNPKTANIPIIMVSSRSKQEHLQEVLEAGAIDFIQKPYQKSILLRKIEEVLKIKMVA